MPARILFLDHTAAKGGGEIALLRLLRVLDRSRFTPTVILFEDGPFADELRQSGIDTRILPLSSRVTQARKDALGAGSLLKIRALADIITFVFRLAGQIRAIKPDLVHTNSLKSDLLGAVAARLACRPVVWHVRDRIVPEYLPGKVVRIFRWLCRFLPTRVVTNSHSTLDSLQPRAGSRRYCVVHDGTPMPAGPPADFPSETRVGLVGRISPWKGQHIFLRAIAKIRHQFSGTKFQIIGSALFDEAGYEQEIRSLSSLLGLDDCVEFTGFQANVEEVMQSLTLLVHASTIGEPFGQVVIEAMAAGRPLIATRGGGVPEIVEHDHTGLLVPMNDPDALAGAIAALLSDPARMRTMGQLGRQRVIDAFTIERTARNLEMVFDDLLPSRPQPHSPAPEPLAAKSNLPSPGRS